MGKRVGESAGLRVLGRLRISRDRNESTSIERQREVVEAWAKANGHQIIGFAVDESVSGSVDPFDTPELGDWLRNRPQDFSCIAAWKLDRLGRDSIKLNRLFGWCIEHDVALVSCSEGVDLSTPVGRLIANVVAFLAEGEAEAIRERVSASRDKLRREARWPGGRPPYGYRQTRNDAGDGWILKVDKDAAKVVRRIVNDLLAGKALNAVATELNAKGVLAPSEHYRKQTGKPVGGSKWRQSPMKLMLRSKALLGYVHYQGEVIRDDDGAPIRMAPELISLEDFNRVQAVLDGVEAKFARPTRNPSPFSGLVSCCFCDTGLTFTANTVHGRRYGYYRHPVNSECAEANLIPVDVLSESFEQSFLFALDDVPIREQVWQQGDSREAELREALQAFDDLTAAAGKLTSQTARARLQGQLSALDAQIGVLEAAPRVEGGWVWVDVGGTYGDAWRAAADDDARRELLRRSGITVAAGVRREGRRSKLNDGVWFIDVRIPPGLMPADKAARYEAAAAAERARWGIPED